MSMKRCSIRTVIGWLAFFSTVGSPAMASEAGGGPEKHPSKDGLFDRMKIIKIGITLDKEAIDSLNTNAFYYVSARIEEGGLVYPKVGLHLKGVSTFEKLDQKPSVTLKFDLFDRETSFHGLSKVMLNNAHGEDTYIQELLARDCFLAAGVKTPRVNYARLTLNGRELGLYLLIEGITGDFLKEAFGTKKGNLYEADENDVNGQMEQDYGKRSRRQMDLTPLVTALKEPDLSKRFAELEKVLDLDEFISYVAVEALINVWDGYTMRLNNYRVFCNHLTGKVTFIPHGLDNIFAEPDYPLVPETKGLVSRAVLETPEGMRRYRKRVAELQSTMMKKEALYKKIDGWVAVIRPTLTELGQAKPHQRAIVVIKKRIESRLEFIDKNLPAFLEGKSP